MITEIPDFADFQHQGIAFLNLAWDSVFSLVLRLEDASQWHAVDSAAVSEKYWDAAEHALATSMALAHQGTEFLIKSHIAEVSPYLLLSVREWKKKWSEEDTPFSAFYTVDTQDLVRLHNVVAKNKLPEDFVRQFESLRALRNTITHTVDRNLKLTVKEIIMAVLFGIKHLVRDNDWISLRRNWLEGQPYSVAFDVESGEDYLIAKEMKFIIDWLSPAEMLTFFDFDKKRRRYICDNCSKSSEVDAQFRIESALLSPNTPESTTVHCFVCGQDSVVVRQRCPNCKGNVIDPEWSECLSCGRQVDVVT